MFALATVTATSPLTVRIDGSSTAVPAKVAVAAFSPALSARVIVFTVSGRLYVLGAA